MILVIQQTFMSTKNKSSVLLMNPDRPPPPTIWIETPLSDHYRYLGIIIGLEVDINEIFNEALNKFLARLSKISRSIPFTDKVWIYKIFLLPIFSYLLRFFSFPKDILNQII